MFFRAAFFTFLLAMVATCVTASPGDKLYVLKSGVNVRSGPSTDRTVVMQLNKGHELTEIERQGPWIHAEISWTGGEGWIHDSLTGSTPPDGTSAPRTDAELESFIQDIENLNRDVREILGDVFFKRVREVEDGSVQLTATRIWLSAPQEQREKDLVSLFALWQAHQGPETPVALTITDSRGNPVMEKSSR